MANKVIASPKFSLQTRDFLKGLLIAVITAVLTSIYEFIDSDALLSGINWNTVIKVGLGAGISYVLKNWLLEPAKVITTYSTNKKAETVAENVKSQQ